MAKKKQAVNGLSPLRIEMLEGALIFEMRPRTIFTDERSKLFLESVILLKEREINGQPGTEYIQYLSLIADVAGRTETIEVDLEAAPGLVGVEQFWKRLKSGEALVDLAEFYVLNFSTVAHNAWGSADDEANRGLVKVEDLDPALLTEEEAADPKSKSAE